jgi:hypothetical protein
MHAHVSMYKCCEGVYMMMMLRQPQHPGCISAYTITTPRIHWMPYTQITKKKYLFDAPFPFSFHKLSNPLIHSQRPPLPPLQKQRAPQWPHQQQAATQKQKAGYHRNTSSKFITQSPGRKKDDGTARG